MTVIYGQDHVDTASPWSLLLIKKLHWHVREFSSASIIIGGQNWPALSLNFGQTFSQIINQTNVDMQMIWTQKYQISSPFVDDLFIWNGRVVFDNLIKSCRCWWSFLYMIILMTYFTFRIEKIVPTELQFKSHFLLFWFANICVTWRSYQSIIFHMASGGKCYNMPPNIPGSLSMVIHIIIHVKNIKDSDTGINVQDVFKSLS